MGWIGFDIHWAEYRLGISEKRAQWLIEWSAKILNEGCVEVAELVAVLGRYSFAMQPLEHLRPFLAPIFAWAAAVMGAGKLQLPWSVGFLLKFLANQLGGSGRMVEVKLRGIDLGEAFRADAKAMGSTVRVGGWECINGKRPKEARWFSLELSRSSAPWAFARGEPFRTIAALELLGTLLCVVLFSPEWPTSAKGTVRLAGSTDNLGNCWVVSKLMCTKFPLVCILGELAVQLRDRNLALGLEWVPRLQNEEADGLTNEDFSIFTAERRMNVELDHVRFKVLPDLFKVGEDLHHDIVLRRASRVRQAAKGLKKVRLRESDPWG